MTLRRRGALGAGLLLPLLAVAAPAQPAAASWLDMLMQRLARIPARRADFVEQKQIAALTRPLVSRGHLLYVRPAQLEKITTAPQPETLIIDGDQLSISTEDAPPKTLSLASAPAIAGLVEGVRATLAGDLPGLRRLYRIVAEGGLGHWRLTLTPARPPLARLLHAVTIEGAQTDIRTITVDQANGDRQVMTIMPSP